MKNSLIILAASAITVWAFGFKKVKQTYIYNTTPSIRIDTLKNKLDSLENTKTLILNKYAAEIEDSYETVKNEKKKQEELLLSADSILDLVASSDTISNINITKK